MQKEFTVYAIVENRLAMWQVQEKTIALAIRAVQNELPPRTAALVLVK